MSRALQTVIDFGAEWCGPCRLMTPIYEALSSKFIKTMVFLRADAGSVCCPTIEVWVLDRYVVRLWRKLSECRKARHILQGGFVRQGRDTSFVIPKATGMQELAQTFGISSLPTFQVWRGGQKVGELVGANQNLESWLQQFSTPFTATFQGQGRTLAGVPVLMHITAGSVEQLLAHLSG